MYEDGNNDWINNNCNDNEWAVAYRLGRGHEEVFNNFYTFGPAQICHNDEDLNNKGKKLDLCRF